jgi:hypothetical protein
MHGAALVTNGLLLTFVLPAANGGKERKVQKCCNVANVRFGGVGTDFRHIHDEPVSATM